uniref:Coiled-coil-helix-coiled-coil-helix domain-containing protein 7 n=1 Tax=Culicoides sonorensis TaxID=179676 RepID=A0A336K7X8_CULSO
MSVTRESLRNSKELENNPCLKEQKLSFKCLDHNAYDAEKCEVFFQNYKNCKDFWSKVQKDRRRAGKTPLLPPLSERDAIKAEYMKTKPNQ